LQKEAAYQWSLSFDDAITAYTKAVEHYEWAQLCAEVAIILCSVSLLLNTRSLWIGGLVLGITGVTIIGLTYSAVHNELHLAETKIEVAAEKFKEFNTDSQEREDDERLLQDVEKQAQTP
jgi:hypothetical protein